MPRYTEQTESIMAREAASSLCLNTLPFAIRYRLSEFSGSEFKVWMAHLSHAHRKDKRSFISIALLRRETGLSLATVKAARRGLIKNGWMVRYKAVDKKTGKRKSSTVYCKWPPPIPGTMYAALEERKEASSGEARI